MKKQIITTITLTCLISTLSIAQSKPILLESWKIWDKGAHNAFTDIIRFNGKFYCTFREADSHAGGTDGKIRLIQSTDGKTFTSAALIAEEGVDLRDPKLSITPDNKLMIAAGGSVYEGRTLTSRQPRVTFSKDAKTFTKPIPVLKTGDWLWRVTWNKKTAYGVSYRTDAKDWALTLYKSTDGIDYEKIANLTIPGRANETTLRFCSDDTMVAFVRRESGTRNAYIGTSKPPYKEWSWYETAHEVGGPDLIILPDNSMWAGGRSYPGGAKTVFAEFGPEKYNPVITLPSGGDTSYPGFTYYDDILWMSYYASHEGKTSIYLAKIKLP